MRNLFHIRYLQYIFIAIFLIIGYYLTVQGSYDGYIHHNSWKIGDWLINYQAGFIRRGLLGELILKLSHYSKIDPGKIVFYIQIILYFIFFLFSYLSLLKQENLKAYWLLIFSPFIFYFQVFDIQGGFRKEIIFFAILSVVVWGAITLKEKKFEILFIITLLLYPFFILTHEMLALLLPYILMVYIIKSPLTKKKLKYLAPLLLLSVIAFFASILHHGDPSMTTSIFQSLKISGYPLKGGAISALSGNLDSAFHGVIRCVETRDYLRIYGMVFILSLLGLIPILPKLKALFHSKVIIFLLTTVLMGYFALNLSAIDWGRFIYINFVSLFLTSLVFNDNKNKFNNICSTFLLLLSIIYFSLWHIPHCGGEPIIRSVKTTNIDTIIKHLF